jgi:hypothetical protein
MCVVWCASSKSARWLMRRTHSSDSVAPSRNPRARSIDVSPAVITLVIVKRGANPLTSQFPAEGTMLEGGKKRVHLGQRGPVRGLQFPHGGNQGDKLTLENERRDCNGANESRTIE